jgi:tetratricopeptide (TPR) repeat protein
MNGSSAGFACVSISASQYAMTQPGVILHYLQLSIWPVSLCFDYLDWPVPPLRDALLPIGAVGLMALATLIGLLRRRWWGFVGAWFFVILAPTSSFMPIQDRVVEHRMYLPLAAVVLGLVVAGALSLYGLARLLPESPRARAALGWTVGSVVVGILCVLSVRRNMEYRSPETLWADVTVKRPNNVRGWTCLAEVQIAMGKFEETRESTERALSITPYYYNTHSVLANVLLKEGKLDEALARCQTGLRLAPDAPHYHHLLALIQFARGDRDGAAAACREACRLNPKDSNYWMTLAMATGESDPEESDRALRRSLELNPGWPLAVVRASRRSALQADPRQSELRLTLGQLQTANRALRETDAEALDALGITLARTGRFEEAVAAARKALTLAEKVGRDEFAKDVMGRIQGYQKRQAYEYVTVSEKHRHGS